MMMSSERKGSDQVEAGACESQVADYGIVGILPLHKFFTEIPSNPVVEARCGSYIPYVHLLLGVGVSITFLLTSWNAKLAVCCFRSTERTYGVQRSGILCQTCVRTPHATCGGVVCDL